MHNTDKSQSSPLATSIAANASADLDSTTSSNSSSVDVWVEGDPVSLSPLASVFLLKTDAIDPGHTPNRLAEAYTSEAFDTLATSILAHRGNSQPIVVRALRPEELKPRSPYQFILISGSRRLHACAMYQLPVRAIVEHGSVTTELIECLMENQLREALSPYELGMQLRHLLQSPSSLSERALARLTGLDNSIVNKALHIAALPQEVIAAFMTPADIQYRDAKALKDLVASDYDAVMACAQRLKGQGLSGKEVIAQLLDAAKNAARPEGSKDDVEPFNSPAGPIPLTVNGQSLGEITVNKKGVPEIRLSLPLTAKQQAELGQHIESFIRRKVLRLPAVKSTVNAPVSNDAAIAPIDSSASTPASSSDITAKERAR